MNSAIPLPLTVAKVFVDADDDVEIADCNVEIADGEMENGKSSDETGKSIGTLGSVSIAVNSLAGPAVLQLPYQFQKSGIIPTTVGLIVVGIISAYTSLHMANVVSKVPGNHNFDKCIEFSDGFRVFWSKHAYQITQLLFYLTAVCLNMAAIVDTAQTVDSFFGLHYSTYGVSFGLDGQTAQLVSWEYHKHCSRTDVKLGVCDPFNDELTYGTNLLTLGYLLTTAVFVPICLMDMQENIWWQIFGFGLLITLSAYFCIELELFQLSMENVSLWGQDWGDMFGFLLFNFALVLAVPAWLHEKKESVSVHRVVHGSTFIALVLYLCVGIIGALAIPNVNPNMLAPMMSGALGSGVQLGASVFAFFIIGLDIPLFSVLTRYNLTHSGLCSVRTANWLVVWFPWSMAWIFYQGDAIANVLNWGGLFFMSVGAFLLPLYLALKTLKENPDKNGSIAVHGSLWTSYEAQVRALTVLFAVTCLAVVIAFLGQLASTHFDFTLDPSTSTTTPLPSSSSSPSSSTLEHL